MRSCRPAGSVFSEAALSDDENPANVAEQKGTPENDYMDRCLYTRQAADRDIATLPGGGSTMRPSADCEASHLVENRGYSLAAIEEDNVPP
jgi:hypothetical protein